MVEKLPFSQPRRITKDKTKIRETPRGQKGQQVRIKHQHVEFEPQYKELLLTIIFISIVDFEWKVLQNEL